MTTTSTNFDAFWSLWSHEAVSEIQFDGYWGFPIFILVGESK